MIVGCGGFGRKTKQKRGLESADDLMAVVSSQNKQTLTVQGKIGDL